MNRDIFNNSSDEGFFDSSNDINMSQNHNDEYINDDNNENDDTINKGTDMPQPVKNKIGRLIGCTLIIYVILIGSGFIIKDFNNVPLIIAFSFFALYIYIACLGLYLGIKYKGYTVFSGVIIDIKKETLSKNIYNIQFYDEKKDQFISFSYCGANIPGTETPITLYVFPDEPIKQTENGYFVEHYLTCVFSSDYNDKVKEIQAKDL